MIKPISEFKPYLNTLNIDRLQDIAMQDFEEETEKMRFLKAIDFENKKNKSKLVELLGGTKTYMIIEYEHEKINYNQFETLISEEIPNLVMPNDTGWNFYPVDSHLYHTLYRFKQWHYIYSNDSIDKNKLVELIKKECLFMPRVSNIRDLPKWSRLLRMIFDDCIEVFKITNNYESLYAKLSDMLSRKSKKYILELSTDCRDMLTASVSSNFTSCFNIKKGGSNRCSVNYLTIDNNTLVAKVYTYDDENIKAMESGVMPYDRAVARRFISLDTDNNFESMILGRAYPDDSILSPNELASILEYKLLNLNIATNIRHTTSGGVNYGYNYSGYEDYNCSRTHFYTFDTERFRMKVGNKGAIIYSPITDEYAVTTNYKLIPSSICLLSESDYRNMGLDDDTVNISKNINVENRGITDRLVESLIDETNTAFDLRYHNPVNLTIPTNEEEIGYYIPNTVSTTNGFGGIHTIMAEPIYEPFDLD